METTLDSIETSTKAERAGFGVRLGAMLIDTVIVVALAITLGPLLGGLLGGLAGAESSENAVVGGMLGMLAGLVITAPFIYFLYFFLEAIMGATLGKMILGLKIGTAEGQHAAIPALMTRYFIKSSGTILSVLSLVLGLTILGDIGGYISLAITVGCFFVLGKQKQSFHDMGSKTAVYKKSELA